MAFIIMKNVLGYQWWKDLPLTIRMCTASPFLSQSLRQLSFGSQESLAHFKHEVIFIILLSTYSNFDLCICSRQPGVLDYQVPSLWLSFFQSLIVVNVESAIAFVFKVKTEASSTFVVPVITWTPSASLTQKYTIRCLSVQLMWTGPTRSAKIDDPLSIHINDWICNPHKE